MGGYRPGSGRGKGGWMKNIMGQDFYLQSSYEIRLANILNSQSVLWERPDALEYILDGVSKRYYGDFYIPSYGVYIDTKNDYLIKIDAPKIEAVREQNNVRLHIFSNKEINEEYVKLFVSSLQIRIAG
jgi:hypothetical protein